MRLVDQLGEAIAEWVDAREDIARAAERAAQVKADARERAEAARLVLADAIVEAYLDGGRVGQLARRTGYTRESIRRILRTAGVAADE